MSTGVNIQIHSVALFSSMLSLLQRMGSAEKPDSAFCKQEPPDNSADSEALFNSSGDTSRTDVEPSASGVQGAGLEHFPVKSETETHSSTASVALETASCGQTGLVKVEPESTQHSATDSCLSTSSPIREASSSGACSSYTATSSPVETNTNSRTPVRTAAAESSPPVRWDVAASPLTLPQPSTVGVADPSVNSSLGETNQGVGRHSLDDRSEHLHTRTQPADSAVPTCSESGAVNTTPALGSSRPAQRVDSDSDMDTTQVDVVSHSEPCDRDAIPNESSSSQEAGEARAPVEQQGPSTVGHSQGFEVTMSCVEDEESAQQPSSQVDSSEGSITFDREQEVVDSAADASRSRHCSSDSVGASHRSRHQSAADSVSEQLEAAQRRPDSRQEHRERCSLNVRYAAEEQDTVQAGPCVGDAEALENPNSLAGRDVEEGEVSEEEDQQVGSSGAAPTAEEIEEGEIVESDEEKERESPTSSSAQPQQQPSDSVSDSAAAAQQPTPPAASRDEQAVTCSTDPGGLELVSSGEDLNQSGGVGGEWGSDGEAVQSSGIVTAASSSDPKLPRNNSQSLISSSDHTTTSSSLSSSASQTVSAAVSASAEISADIGALQQTCSSTDSLVGSSHPQPPHGTAGLFSCRLSSSSLTSSSSAELNKEASDTEVDSTSSHWQTAVGRSGVGHASRSPADVSSSSSSLNADTGVSNSTRPLQQATFTARWPSGGVTASAAASTSNAVGDAVPPEEPSSSEPPTPTQGEAAPSPHHLPHASTTFGPTSSSSAAAHPSSTTNTSPAPQNKKKVTFLLLLKKRGLLFGSLFRSGAKTFFTLHAKTKRPTRVDFTVQTRVQMPPM